MAATAFIFPVSAVSEISVPGAWAAPAPGHGLIEHDLHEALETAEAAPRAHDAVYRLVLFVGTRRRMIRADTGQGAVQHVFPEPVSGLGGPQGRRALEDRATG